jgi:hypothetical protein
VHGDEQVFAVLLDLRALVGGNGVFQREFVQAELLAQPGDGGAVGGLQFDPDEALGIGDMLADGVEFDRLDPGIVEEQAVDGGLRWLGNGNALILAVLGARRSPGLRQRRCAARSRKRAYRAR